MIQPSLYCPPNSKILLIGFLNQVTSDILNDSRFITWPIEKIREVVLSESIPHGVRVVVIDQDLFEDSRYYGLLIWFYDNILVPESILSIVYNPDSFDRMADCMKKYMGDKSDLINRDDTLMATPILSGNSKKLSNRDRLDKYIMQDLVIRPTGETTGKRADRLLGEIIRKFGIRFSLRTIKDKILEFKGEEVGIAS